MRDVRVAGKLRFSRLRQFVSDVREISRTRPHPDTNLQCLVDA